MLYYALPTTSPPPLTPPLSGEDNLTGGGELYPSTSLRMTIEVYSKCGVIQQAISIPNVEWAFSPVYSEQIMVHPTFGVAIPMIGF